MCGIVSLFAYHESAPPVDRDELLRVRDRMITRGPDGAGEWYSDDRRVGLGHRRLAIIDLSEKGAQPYLFR
jgi:asparagine synthase (glutamine-hydrolysing)